MKQMVTASLCLCLLSMAAAGYADPGTSANNGGSYDEYFDFDSIKGNKNQNSAPPPSKNTGTQKPAAMAKPAAGGNAAYQGQIFHQATQAPPPVSPAQFVQVTQSSIPLEGRLKGKFSGFKFTLKNLSDGNIEIMKGEIVNGVDGATAYRKTDNSRSRGFLAGLASMPLSYVPYGGYGSSAVSTSAGYAGAASDEQTDQASMGKTKFFPSGMVIPTDEISIEGLVPLNEKPEIKIIFRDLKTNEVHMYKQ